MTKISRSIQFSSVQSLSRVWLFVTLWIAARQAYLSITNSQSLLKLMPIESVMPSNHLILCRPLLLLPPILPSIRVFSNESTLHMRWPKYWSFSFSISPSNEHPGLISFRMGWLDLLAVQGTPKSLLQHHSSKASSFRRSASFTVQLSHPYMTTGKTIALTRWTLVGKVMSLQANSKFLLARRRIPQRETVATLRTLQLVLWDPVWSECFSWGLWDFFNLTGGIYPETTHLIQDGSSPSLFTDQEIYLLFWSTTPVGSLELSWEILSPET